jgi:hypothetical protein
MPNYRTRGTAASEMSGAKACQYAVFRTVSSNHAINYASEPIRNSGCTENPEQNRSCRSLKQRAFSLAVKLMRRAAVCLRVSTQDQTIANQERELREVASRMACEIVHVYRDHGVSGAKARDLCCRRERHQGKARPVFRAMRGQPGSSGPNISMSWSSVASRHAWTTSGSGEPEWPSCGGVWTKGSPKRTPPPIAYPGRSLRRSLVSRR